MKTFGLMIIGFLLSITLIGWYMLHEQYYYVKITTDGELIRDSISERIYEYNLKGYDKNGNEKNLTFVTHPTLNRPFKKNAYLKIIYTNWKKEYGYEEVKKSDVPKKSLNKLE